LAAKRHQVRERLLLGQEIIIRAKLGHRARDRALDGSGADPENVGDLGFGHVLEVAEHDRGPHALWQAIEGALERVVQFPVA
jgi:hypothetical protein